MNKEVIVDLSSDYIFDQFQVQRIIFSNRVDKMVVIPLAMMNFFNKWAQWPLMKTDDSEKIS